MSAEALREALVQAEPKARIGLALDGMTRKEAFHVMHEVGPYIGFVKSNSIARSRGVKSVKQWADVFYFDLMADAKCFDTERTVSDDVKSMTEDGARLITVHASLPQVALEVVVEERNKKRADLQERLGEKFDPLAGTLLGITVLTLYDNETCMDTYGAPVQPTVMKFARRARRSGFEGIVCAVDDLNSLQADEELRTLLKVTPGIVLPGTSAHSGQTRTATPGEAIEAGADYIILGSAVTKADSPLNAAKMVLGEVMEAVT